MAALTSPQRNFNELEADDKYCLQYLPNFVYDGIKMKIHELFTKLDKDESGELDGPDFESTIASVHEIYQRIYGILLENFDFDGGRTIDRKEFFEGFILHAWLGSCEFMGPPAAQPTFGKEFHQTIFRFNHGLDHKIDELIAALDGRTLPAYVPPTAAETMDIAFRSLSSGYGHDANAGKRRNMTDDLILS